MTKALPASSESAFSSAIREFTSHRTKKKTPKFIHDVVLGGSRTSPQDVQESILQWEKANSQRKSRKVMKPVFDALKDYDGVISTLCQADPMPSALIWGGMKAVIDCFTRYTQVFISIEDQLVALTQQLKRLNNYEELFTESDDMRELLVSTYLDILRFWAKVEEQCSTSAFVLAAKSLTSFSVEKLNEIVSDINDGTDNIAKLVPIVQERLRRRENEKAGSERFQVGVNLDQILKNQRQDREMQKVLLVKAWITSGQALNANNHRHQYQRQQERLDGTCQWLFETEKFQYWVDSDSGSNIIWLCGGPGVGKSVTCIHVIDQLEAKQRASVVAFHLFSFDTSDTIDDVYRNIAIQLFTAVYSSDSEEVSDNVLYIARREPRIRVLKELIKILIAETTKTFICLDGLDEVCSSGMDAGWVIASDVVAFFVELAKQESSPLKLWCSSQDRRNIRALLPDAIEIQLGAADNSDDIEKYLTAAFDKGELRELDEVMVTSALAMLRVQVNGNFLWASLMVDTMLEATSAKDLLEAIVKGLPEDFERYLEKRIQAIKPNKRPFVRKVLSCLVYAKRPLSLDELCEAVQIFDTDEDFDLESSCHIFRGTLVDNCIPFIRVDEAEGEFSSPKCALSHGSVRTFLVENPTILGDAANCKICSSVLADICLKYLKQPRYRNLLTKVKGSFIASSPDDDILDHAFLIYSAKYWHRHMDDLLYSPELCQKVEDFVRSTNFLTCLQVKALLVEGTFQIWVNSHDPTKRYHLVRTFPEWFTGRHHCGGAIQAQYHDAVGEWLHHLNWNMAPSGKYPGQIDRCFWGALGKENFLHRSSSIYKSFMFEKSDLESASDYVYSRVGADGTELTIFRLKLSTTEDSEAQCLVENWKIAPGRSPKLKSNSIILFPAKDLLLYTCPLKEPIPGRASPVSFSPDGVLLRVGTQLYERTNSKDLEYKPLKNNLETSISYIEEVACTGEYLAICSNSQLTYDDLNLSILAKDENAEASHEPDGTSSGSNDSDDSDSSSSSSSEASESQEVELENDEEGDARSKSDSKSIAIESHVTGDRARKELDEFDTSSESSMSAKESWSESSTAQLSNEIEDEEIWNDFASDNSSIDLKDNLDNLDAESIEADGIFDFTSSSDSSGLSHREDGSEVDADLRSSRESAAEPSSPVFTAYESSDSEDDEAGPRHDNWVEQLLGKRQNRELERFRCHLQIFERQSGSEELTKHVFRFDRKSTSRLYSSPPIFHPTIDLLVWPLGDGEVLFANFTQRTYFTRFIRFAYWHCCQISVQCQFSHCGRFLHLASLDGVVMQYNGEKTHMELKLHISTHRMSDRSPARTPPRLIYRNSISLDDKFDESEKLQVNNLPFTLTWTRDHVFVSESGVALRVHRIPLFREVEVEQASETAQKGVYQNSTDIFLPLSCAHRKVHFFALAQESPDPENAGTGKKPPKSSTRKHKNDPSYTAQIILGASNVVTDLPGPNVQDEKRLSRGLKSPQGVHVTDAQFGELRGSGEQCLKQMIRAETWRGGQLLAKSEKFDVSEDCDIVPYLHV